MIKGKGIVYVLRIIPPHSYSRAGKLCRPLGNEILAYCLRFFFLNKWEIIWTSLSRCLFTQETHLDCGKITSNGHKDSATLMWNFCSTYTSVQLVKHRGSCRYFVLEGSWSLQCMTLKSLEHDSTSLSSVTLTFMLQATWRAYPEKEYEKVDRNLPISLIVRNNRHICRKIGPYMVMYTLADTKANKGFDNRSNHHAFMMRMTRHRKLSLFRWYFWFEYFSIIFKISCGMVFVFSNWQITWRYSFKRHIAVDLLFLSISCFEFEVHTLALYVMLYISDF